MELTLPNLMTFLQGAGLTGALVFFLYGGYKKWWVWGYQLEDCKVELESWKDLALRNSNLASAAVKLADKPNRDTQ